MQLMLGCGSLWAQSAHRRDTHSTLAAQLLQQQLEGGQLGDPGSLCSFCWPVPGEGAEKELRETQAASCFSSQPWELFQAALKLAGTSRQC